LLLFFKKEGSFFLCYILMPPFEQIVLPHLDAAYNLARWLVRDPTLAEDIVQDACERAIRYFGSFRGADSRAWLLQIVRNTCYAKLKNSQGMSNFEDYAAELPDPAPGPEAAFARVQDMARLEAVLAALPVQLRECLVLCELEQLSYKDIARITEVPIGTVMSRLSRARKLIMRHSAVGQGA
jgi:RNA polymerase sigma-70 factor (ECF subfamily)